MNEFTERRKIKRDETFRKYNGMSERLYKDKKYLYLKAISDNFSFATARDTEMSITRSILEHQPFKVILDLSCISKVDSAAIGVLLFLRSECLIDSREILLMNISEDVQKTFNLLKISEFFRIIQSFEEI